MLDDPTDPDEIVQAALLLLDDDQVAARLRANAHTTARLHTWNALIPVLLSKLTIAAHRQGLRGL